MRNRSLKVTKEYNNKVLRTVFEAIKEGNFGDKKFMRKIVQVAQRTMNLDMAKAF
jgi:hypothetical protein